MSMNILFQWPSVGFIITKLFFISYNDQIIDFNKFLVLGQMVWILHAPLLTLCLFETAARCSNEVCFEMTHFITTLMWMQSLEINRKFCLNNQSFHKCGYNIFESTEIHSTEAKIVYHIYFL